jgi:predicted nucleotidyltransferase
VQSSPDLSIDGQAIDRARLAAICQRHGVTELAVFGSVARGDASPMSDVDVLYVLEPGGSLGFALNDLEDELTEVFGRRVDLVSKQSLHRAMRDRVLAEARTIYAA